MWKFFNQNDVFHEISFRNFWSWFVFCGCILCCNSLTNSNNLKTSWYLLQVVKLKCGKPDFKGLPFQNFPDDAKKFSNYWNALWKYNKNYIMKNKSRPEVAEKHKEKLKNEKMLCPHLFSGLLAQIATHPPRLPYKPP